MADEKQPLVFTNTVTDASTTPPHYATTTIQNFTATGRPFNPSEAKKGSGLVSLNSTDAMGLDLPDILPRRYNDNSLISIPVLPPESILTSSSNTKKSSPGTTAAKSNNIPSPDSPTSHYTPDFKSPTSPGYSPVTPTSPPSSPTYRPATTIVYADLYAGTDPIQHEPTSKMSLKFWHRRKSSASSPPLSPQPVSSPAKPPTFLHRRSASSGKAKIPAFVMKQVTRGEYLKHYAKDEQGKYIGSEDPASDCILRDAEDLQKWRAPGWESASAWKNEV